MSFRPDTKDINDACRGTGIRDIAAIEKISIKKVLSVLVHSRYPIQPKEQYYDCLEREIEEKII
jgi:hypothetical protein